MQEYRANDPDLTRLIEDINEAQFMGISLVKIVKEINNEQDDHSKPKNKGGAFYAGAEADFVKTTVIANPSLLALGIEGTTPPEIIRSTAAVLNLGYDLYFKPDIRSFIFRAGFTMSKLNMHYSANVKPDAAEAGYSANLPAIVHNEFNLDRFTVGISAQIICNLFNGRNTKLFVGTGIDWLYSDYSNAKYIFYDNDYANQLYYNSGALRIPVTMGIVVGKHVEISANYLTPVSVAYKNSIAVATINQVGVGINYLFR